MELRQKVMVSKTQRQSYDATLRKLKIENNSTKASGVVTPMTEEVHPNKVLVSKVHTRNHPSLQASRKLSPTSPISIPKI